MSESDTKVEEILREIRLRVQQENLAKTDRKRSAGRRSSLTVSAGAHPATANASAEGLRRLQAHLPAIERTRNNLPPIVSWREGVAARAELFVKRQIKRLTKWFTYDQLIFNNAVYESLFELQNLHAANEQELTRLDQLISNEKDVSAEIEASLGEIDASLNEIRERLGDLSEQQRVIYKNLLMQMNETSTVTDQWRRSLEDRVTALENTRAS